MPRRPAFRRTALVSTEAVLYEDIGVRVDRVLMTVKPLEIYYSIEYTVVDREAMR